MGWKTGQVIQHLFDLELANPLDKGLKAFLFLTLRHIPARESLHHLRDALRRDRAHGQTIRAGIVRPLATQHNLKVRYGITSRMAAHTVKPEIGNVMLSAGIEATADLDAQVLDSLIQCVTLFRESL